MIKYANICSKTSKTHHPFLDQISHSIHSLYFIKPSPFLYKETSAMMLPPPHKSAGLGAGLFSIHRHVGIRVFFIGSQCNMCNQFNN